MRTLKQRKSRMFTTVLCGIAAAATLLGPNLETLSATCWWKELIVEPAQPCAACVLYTCPGSTKALVQYYKCSVAAHGEIGKTQCFQFNQQEVGRLYSCTIDWDIAKIVACAAGVATCVIVCTGAEVDLPLCVACLVGIGAGCAAGCSLAEGCVKDPDVSSAIRRDVFSNLAGDACNLGG